MCHWGTVSSLSTRAVHVGLIGAGNTDRQVIPTPLLFWRGWLTEGEMSLVGLLSA